MSGISNKLKKGIIVREFPGLPEDSLRRVLRWRNNVAVRKWMYSDRVITSREHFEFIRKLKGDSRNKYWMVSDKNSGEVGVVYLNRIDRLNAHAYLGLYKNPERREPGSGSMLMEVIQFLAFRLEKIHSLKIEVIEDNLIARKIYGKHGFKLEGRLKEYVKRGGRWKDVAVMGKQNG